MSERLQATLDVLSEAPDDRFIIVGSMGRAALLEDAAFPLTALGIERDIDALDTSGELRDWYQFSDAAPVDTLLTRRLRPVDESTSWGLYDPHTKHAEPIVTLPEGLVRLQYVDVPFAAAKIATLDNCTQLAIQRICLDDSKNYKHWRQFRQIRNRLHDTADCGCDEWRHSMGKYHQTLLERREQSRANSVYAAVRSTGRALAPTLFKRMQNGRVGDVVRAVRGTDKIGVHTDESIHDWFARVR